MNDLPKGWVEVPLGTFATRTRNVDPSAHLETVFELYSVPAYANGVPDIAAGAGIGSTKQVVLPGDVLLCKIIPHLNRVWSVPESEERQQIASPEWLVYRDHGCVPDYLRAALSEPGFREMFLQTKSGVGGSLTRARADLVNQIKIKIAPLPEQRRIVAKVDGLKARTTQARKDLDCVPALIARYKQRLLALAFSGELTSEWRKERPSLKTALEKVRANRIAGVPLVRRKRSAALPNYDIPETWSWISPDEVAADAKYSIGIGPFGSNLVRTDYRESGVRLVFVRDIRREKFEDADARYVDESKAAELHQHVAGPGDVLITKMGDPPGDSTLFPMDAHPAVITADCIKLTPHAELATAKYLNFAIRSELVQSQFKAITAGVAQQKVSLDRFRQLALPIAPSEEQAEIVRRIESAFGWLDRMAADHAAAAHLLPKLDTTILAKAFRGELVPQDPNDEPATMLLKRIKAGREAEGKKPKRGHGRTPNVSKAHGMTEKNLTPRDRLLRDSEKWPAVGLPFEAIAMRNSMPHDTLRDALFELLSGPSPAFQQRFDADAEVMVIERIVA